MKHFKLRLEDGTVVQAVFSSEDEAIDFYDIFYGLTVVEIHEVKSRGIRHGM